MAVICPLFSGSSGNSTYIGYGDSGILIDIGVSTKRLVAALEDIDVIPENILGVFITHEHTDHIQGLKVFSKKYHTPIYCSAKTKEAIIKAGAVEDEGLICPFSDEVKISGFNIKRFDTSHDCIGSSGYTVTTPDNKKLGICTDLGCVPEHIITALSGSNLVMVEANHDIAMLRNGRYPAELKMRIASDKGHLSNPRCGDVVSKLANTGTTRFLLAHISKDNNTPLLALESVITSMSLCGYQIDCDYTVDAALPSGNKIVVV